ncbi:hypothetical protein Kpol_1048p39 [Vanderwaltozyma polyspora DSM 70294]|uniref:Aminoacyl-transfer RNA synthetases class-II family profile domain-containing protein n=1 Tax=Vanderwaltozyma polyspora (strain ATCC 22028 / DSM 70294 / BCRC 21397 / CBS 2163 / NBRC 10782 / NRRL Y-8283 / UCD 57-17) TaxID=436907 RepID=A7TGK1_VANPO|nr:uncharacterized protein Kpol_1048p39 [Vanderwaltozyma polyspora DSM 70294]EDO18608.1 hypothetical protein Kpol_1048p39 [Vanderwaltozyma polyspora DSM 70294]
MLRTCRKFSLLSRLQRELPKTEGIKAKFQFKGNSITIEQAKSLEVGTKVVINGWLDRKPKKIGKGLIFGNLRDIDGNKIQIVDTNSKLKGGSVEDVVQIEGILGIKKDSNDNNSTLDSGKVYEIKLDDITTLNKANEKPSQLQDFKIKGNYPPEYRYLQLRLPEYQKFLKKRYNISTRIREYLASKAFTEVETPILFKSTPEGAREFLVPTRKESTVGKLPLFYSLPQSPQQYKQLLMASGVNRYFQIAKCFRDEDLRADRQPEFTQVDLEMAFSSGEDVMNVVEELIPSVWKEFAESGPLLTLNENDELVEVTKEQPAKRMTYKEAMTKYGIDKPDLRAPNLQITDLSEFNVHSTQHKNFPVFEVMVLKNAFRNIEDYNKNWTHLSNSDNYPYRTPIVVPIADEETRLNWFEKFLTITDIENPKLVSNFLNLEKGDIICGSTREKSESLFENPTPLGKLRQLVLETKLGVEKYASTRQDVASWVVDFPLFSPQEVETIPKDGTKLHFPQYKENSFTSTHHPFTMVRLQDYEKLSTDDPSQCLGQHYDLVVSGVELGGGSTRIHDPELQNYIFHNILKINDPENLFGHLLQAFKMGTPPHAGLAIGFDRMCAMVCGRNSIRDVIAFPKSISGSDTVVGSPSTVNEEILKMYNVEYFKKTK